MKLEKGQVWRVGYKHSNDSANYKKVRPYVICQEVVGDFKYVLMAPIAEDNGRLYPFQQRIYHKKSSKVHYENMRLVPVNLLKKFQGTLKEQELRVMDNCLVELMGLQLIDFTKILELKVSEINPKEVLVSIDYLKQERVISFDRMDFYNNCVGYANLLEDSEKLGFFLSTFKGLQFLREKGRLECVNSHWTLNPSLGSQ